MSKIIIEQRILVIQTAFVGDLLLSIPLLKRLKKRQPSAHISVLCRRGLGEFLQHFDLCHEVFEIDKTSGQDWANLRLQLKQINWDWIICPHRSFRSAWLTFRLTAIRKTGFRFWWNFLFFTERLKRQDDLPDALRQLSLLINDDKSVAPLLNSYREQIDHHINLPLVPDAAQMTVAPYRSLDKVQKFLSTLDGTKKIAVVAPGSVWPTKRWSLSSYTDLCAKLLQSSYQVVLIGAENEREDCKKIQMQLPDCVVVAGHFKLHETAEFLSHCEIVFCNDSGAMHLTACANTKTISIFGPTTLDLGYRPWQNQAQVIEVNLPCRPCGKHGSIRCPIGTHACMKEISVERVYTAFTKNVPG